MVVGSMRDSSSEIPAVVGSMEDSSSEVSAIVKSDRVAMLMEGEWMTGVAGDVGIGSASLMVTGSGGEG